MADSPEYPQETAGEDLEKTVLFGSTEPTSPRSSVVERYVHIVRQSKFDSCRGDHFSPPYIVDCAIERAGWKGACNTTPSPTFANLFRRPAHAA